MKFHNPLKKNIKTYEEREKDIDTLNDEIAEKEKVIAQLEEKKRLQEKLKSLKKDEKELLFPKRINLKKLNTSGFKNVLKTFEGINDKADKFSNIMLGDMFNNKKPKSEEEEK